MNLFKFQALVAEFPFIAETVMKRKYGGARAVENCEGIRIARITKEVLQSTPSIYRWTGSLVNIHKWDRVDFVVNGTIVMGAVKASGESGSNYAYEGTHDWAGESILEAIHRHQVSDQLAFVVWTKGGYVVENHESMSPFKATIYKPNRGFTWQEAIEEAQQRASDEVKAESNF